MSHDAVVIVGGSLAGLHTAEALRGENWTGPIVVVDADDEPRFDRPPMSKEYLAGTVPDQKLLLRDRARLDGLGATWLLGQAVTAVEPARRVVRLADGRELAYADLVIATGVSPILPRALAVPSAHLLRRKADADRLRQHLRPDRSLIVIGAGFIGLEVAATFRAAGARVDVVEALATPLLRQVGPQVGGALRRIHERAGVVFHLGRQATSVTEQGDGVAVTLDDGARLTADALLVAVGSVPGTAFLEGSGLEVADGVVADGHLQVAPYVHAAGDVVRWPHPLAGRSVRIEHWMTAIEQAKYVAKRIAGTGGDEPFAALPYFWSDQYDRKLQVHGFPSADAHLELLDGDLDADRFAAVYLVDGRATAVVAVNHPRQVLAGRRRVLAELALQEAP
ncbi:NAD(P)/FAD-dependent oxidoreductase [Acrocarpospora catenulata]|uniref:NAD(P)/FAD-dependent oxidoreductase n=1 Tax=Acrocarpospora catenulata TaxID=2836182 RepID=UPI001BD99D77|nr:FAD-dependent oxidoreductase [Acrocarpospora catenulata]